MGLLVTSVLPCPLVRSCCTRMETFGRTPWEPAYALASFAPKRKLSSLCALVLARLDLHHSRPREDGHCIEISAPREAAWGGLLSTGVLAPSSLRGWGSREGLALTKPRQAVLVVEVGHALGRRQASLGTPVPRTPTVVVGFGRERLGHSVCPCHCIWCIGLSSSR